MCFKYNIHIFKKSLKWTGNSDEESTSDSELWKGPLPETDEKSQ